MSGARGRITAYLLRDAEGRPVARHVREDTPEGKQVRWQRPDGSWGLNGTPLAGLPLYGADLVSDLGEDELIVLTEGEKARDALEAANIPAVGTVTGASGTPGPDALEVLRDRRVALWADNDPAGHAHMQRIAEHLHGVAAEVLVYTWDEAPEKGDAADHPAASSRDPKALDRLLTDLEGSPRWKPVPRSRAARPPEPSRPVGRLLSEVEAESVEWLWAGRIPLGKITLIEGDPDNGKSALTTDLAARVSVGRPWPDGTPCPQGGAVLLNAEDGLADTIKPRLDAAGGDSSRVLALATVGTGESERMVSVPEDLGIIRRGIERVGALLVVVDPLMAFLSGDVNAHRDQDVRRALAPLKTLAEDTGAAVVVVRHLNKGVGSSPIYRGGGSIGIVGAARSALLVARHPDDERQRVLARVKNNLAEPVPSLAFELAGTAEGSVRVEWKGDTHHAADALLAAPTDPEERSAVDEAKDFLRDALAGGPVWSVEVKKDARKAEISEATLRRAKTALGVRSNKEADGSWSWSLPGVERAHTREDEHLEHVEPLGVDKPKNPAHGVERLEPQGEQDAQGDEQGNPAYLSEDAQGAQGAHASEGDCAGDDSRGLASERVQEVAALLAEPPEWLAHQVAEYRRQGSPKRLLNPLASAISSHLFGSPHRWREVLPEVRERLEEVAM